MSFPKNYVAFFKFFFYYPSFFIFYLINGISWKKFVNKFIKNLNLFKKIIQNKNNKKLISRLSNSKKVRTQIVQLKQDVAKPDFGRE